MPGKERSLLEKMAMRLNRRYYTKSELRNRYIRDEGFPRQEVEQAIRKLEEMQFLNDARFAEDYAVILRSRHYGPLRIRRRLMERGITAPEINRVLAGLFGGNGQDALESALELLKLKTRLYAREPNIPKRKNKALRMLAGKGFPASAAYEAVRKWHEEAFGAGSENGPEENGDFSE